MDWLQSIDVRLFRFINIDLGTPWLDSVGRFLSWNPVFVPCLILCIGALLWRGGRRGRVFVAMLILVTSIGDGGICDSIKSGVGRLRPFNVITDARLVVGPGGSGSMPSSHAANWFAAATIAFVYYRWSWKWMLPLALLISISRVYVGVHYPGDVLGGALLGAGYAAGLLSGLDFLWGKVGRAWFPLWWAKMPSLMNPDLQKETFFAESASQPIRNLRDEINGHWLRLAYAAIAVIFVLRLFYLAGGKIELSEDEAYQWLWSKHLALSYYSKPPMIAYTQFLGTSIWGDNELGVRFFSAVIAATMCVVVIRFLAREVNVRVALWAFLAMLATPLLGVGGVLMTIDPLSVLFWTLAMISGWYAVEKDSTRLWLWSGLWMGLGFLSKYVGLFQLLSWAVFFIVCADARKQLRRPGPYLALLVNALCTLPVLIWNQQNGWITVTHLANRGGLDESWRPTLRFFFDFVGAEFGLLNPVFFVGMVWACFAMWKRERNNRLLLFLFSMSVPLFLFYFFYTFRSRVQPNWIAPSVVPLICLLIIYWEARWREGKRWVKRWATVGVIVGIFVVVVLHDTNLIGKITGRPLSASLDPLRRVRGWTETAQTVGEARKKLLAEGRPVFVIGDHYGITGLLSFYMPEAKAAVRSEPLAYYISSDVPLNQFYFWPGYQARKGQNAIFIQRARTAPEPPPERLEREFASVKDLGIHEVRYRGRVFHRFQLFECRDLR